VMATCGFTRPAPLRRTTRSTRSSSPVTAEAGESPVPLVQAYFLVAAWVSESAWA
jgi:hypothetical protein